LNGEGGQRGWYIFMYEVYEVIDTAWVVCMASLGTKRV
jgi:hypothetical protein